MTILRNMNQPQGVIITLFGILMTGAGLMGCALPIPQEPTPYVVEADPLAALTPCPPSYCWRGKRLADLDLEAAAKLIKGIKGYQDVDVVDERNEAGYRSYSWFRPRERQREIQHVEYLSDNGEFLAIGQAFPSIDIGDVIARFGEPSHVLVYPLSGPSSGQVGFTLFYEDKGLIFHSHYLINRGSDMSKFDITQDASIFAYVATIPGTLSELIHINLLRTSVPFGDVDATTKRWLQATQKWRGYTTYDVADV